MKRENKLYKKKKLKEQVVQKFSYRCPYCDQPVTYDEFGLKVGENKIQCLHCKRIYVKVVIDDAEITGRL